MVHVMTSGFRSPFGIVSQQFDIKFVQTASGPDVEGAFPNLLNGTNARQRQEKTKMIGEIKVGAHNCFPILEILCLKSVSISRKTKTRLGSRRCGAGLDRSE